MSNKTIRSINLDKGLEKRIDKLRKNSSERSFSSTVNKVLEAGLENTQTLNRLIHMDNIVRIQRTIKESE